MLNTYIHRLRPNGTTQQALTLAGATSFRGKCEGAIWSDQYGEWENVVVNGQYSITLLDFSTTVDKNISIFF